MTSSPADVGTVLDLSSADERPLRRGDRGPRVVALRALLARAGGGEVGVDASSDAGFDAALEAAVRAFQQRRGLLADGVVGPQTARALEGARWTLGDRFLRYTPGHLQRGDDVAALQQRLVSLGLLAGPVDGIFGPLTDAALRELQRGLGLEPDGRCGPQVVQALASLARAVGGGDPWSLRQQGLVSAAGRSLAGRVVVLDPAHGGTDRGVVAGGLCEADLVLDLAERAERRFAATGVTTVVTRDATSSPDDAARARLAQAAGADLVISLHCDATSSPAAHGVACFFWGDERVGVRSAVGARLAELVQREVVVRTGLADLAAHARTYDLLRLTPMPAVRVELGYLTHPGDAALLADPAIRDAIAEALVAAVQRLYLGEDDAVTGTLRLADILAHAGLA